MGWDPSGIPLVCRRSASHKISEASRAINAEYLAHTTQIFKPSFAEASISEHPDATTKSHSATHPQHESNSHFLMRELTSLTSSKTATATATSTATATATLHRKATATLSATAKLNQTVKPRSSRRHGAKRVNDFSEV